MNFNGQLRNGAATFSTQQMNVVPSSDLQLDLWEPLASSRSFSVDGHLVSSFVVDRSATLKPNLAPETWVFYVDTSASTADSFLVTWIFC